MPQKKPVKAKPQKPKKIAKPAPKGGVSAALKKAAKVVAKKVGLAPAKKKPEPAKKIAAPKKEKSVPVKAEKPAKLDKKAKPAAAPALPAGKKKAVAPAVKGKAAAPEKTKVAAKAAPAPAAPAKAGKKKGEVVVEVPAPKGVVLLGREGKKARKAADAAAASKKRCREPGCEHELLLSGFCRLHYIKNWRKIKRKEAILASGQLNNYVEELVNKYPDKYLDVIRQDLASEKDWAKVVVDLDLDSAEEEGAGDEDLEGVAEGVRREREFDDDSDTF